MSDTDDTDPALTQSHDETEYDREMLVALVDAERARAQRAEDKARDQSAYAQRLTHERDQAREERDRARKECEPNKLGLTIIVGLLLLIGFLAGLSVPTNLREKIVVRNAPPAPVVSERLAVWSIYVNGLGEQQHTVYGTPEVDGSVYGFEVTCQDAQAEEYVAVIGQGNVSVRFLHWADEPADMEPEMELPVSKP